jgi:hypothetical protein
MATIEKEPTSPILKARKVSLQEVLFPVEQKNPQMLFPNMNFGRQLHNVIYAPTLNKTIDFVGSQYKLTDNESVVMPIYDRLVTIFGESGFKTQCWNEDDRRFGVQFILHDKTIAVAQKDLVNCMIEIQNSYDGTLKRGISLSYYRQICSNGLMGWKKDEEEKQKHVSDDVPSLDKILKRLDNLSYQLQQFRRLQERVVTAREIEDLKEKLKEQTAFNFPKKLIDVAIDYIGTEADLAHSQRTAWIVYNSFNRILNHDDRVGLAMDKIEKIDKNIINTISKELHMDLVLN